MKLQRVNELIILSFIKNTKDPFDIATIANNFGIEILEVNKYLSFLEEKKIISKASLIVSADCVVSVYLANKYPTVWSVEK